MFIHFNYLFFLLQIQGPLLIEVPMQNPKTCAYKYRKDIEIDNIDNFEDTWQWWNEFHAYTDYNPKIKVRIKTNFST